MKRDRWTEEDLIRLPGEEPDDFDRKSGQLFANQNNFLDSTAKALSAFANSGGGSLLLGVEDDGNFDGLPSHVGGATTRDWVEQKIPNLLDYSLTDFRVHTVIKSAQSAIPDGKDVIVIDVGDSAAAPHQSKRDTIYYYRAGGRSVRAPHFYLELLRQRTTNPVLEFALEKISRVDVASHQNGLYFYPELQFRIKNVGRVAAYKWQLRVRSMSGHAAESFPRFHFGDFPVQIARDSGIYLDKSILPGCEFVERENFAFSLPDDARSDDAINKEICEMFEKTNFNYQLATENSPGELVPVNFYSALLAMNLADLARQRLPGFFEQLPERD